MDKFTVRVPATTANLGPGFDCLGLALDIYNFVTVSRSSSFSLSISGEGADSLPRSQENLLYRSLAALYQKVGSPVPELELACQNHIPLRRGLGSSAAAVVGGLMAGQELLGRPLSPQQLLGLATELEGHPDNVAPALMGGCQVVVGGSEIVCAPVPLPRGLVAALFIPDFEIPTQEARAVLPQQVSRADAVYNVGRAALLVAALATGQLGYLRVATQDRLHQPARQALFPAMERIFQAALGAGALGVFLSGSGSTILALVKGRASPIAQAMARSAREAGVKGKTKIARPSLQGAAVI